jgi:soluble lytic murein transglycosylase
MRVRTILTLIAATLAFNAHAQGKGDEVILQMSQAAKRGDSRALAQLLPQVRGHALEPWAAYWEARSRLEAMQPQEFQDFFSRYAGSYQEDRLRNDWLLLLGRRRDFGTFAVEYPKFRMNDDREVRCYAILAEHLRAPSAVTPAMAEEVRRNWFGLRDADDGCTQAAGRLIEAKLMTKDDAWRKARLALDANRPRAAEAAVTLVAPDALGMLGEINASPAKFLAGKKIAIRKERKEIITLALVKLATGDVENTSSLLETQWGPQLTAEERNWLWGQMGKQAASRLDPAAMGYFAKVSRDSDLSEEMLAWKTRAALRAGQWRQVNSAVDGMTPEQRKDPAWTYWKARALLATANAPQQRAEATALLESIASARGFYEQLAMEELGQKITLPARPAAVSPEEKEAARLNPGLNRGLYAILIGLRSEGVREWNYATNLHVKGGLSERELLAAAQLACDNQVWDRCINTSERTKVEFDSDQRFPMPFRDSVVRRSREINLDPAYVYGLIRQESRFVMDARSHVGASGLMQVMPATARWTARRLGMTGFTADQINDRETNIAIGTGYLKLVLDDFAGSMPMAAAAYNAGPGRPRAWRNGPTVEAAIWAENIPFAETRDYVKKVLSNTTNYAAILTGQPQSLKARLGNVGPRDNAQPEPNRDLP